MCLSDRSLAEFKQPTITGNCVDRLKYFFPGLCYEPFYGTELYRAEDASARQAGIMGISPVQISFFSV